MGFHVICECVFRKKGQNMTNGIEKQLTRRQRERLAHMNEVLEAAEECFLQKGYRDATIEDIARKADFAVGSIYTFYKNKEELLCHVVLRIANKQIDDFNECVMPLLENPIAALEALTKVWCEHAIKYGDFLRMSYAVRHVDSIGTMTKPSEAKLSPLNKEIREAFSEFRTKELSVFEKAIEKKLTCDLSADELSIVFEGVAHNYMIKCMIRKIEPTVKSATADLLKIYKTLFLKK